MRSDCFQSFARLIIRQYPNTPPLPDAVDDPVYLLSFGTDVDIHLIGSQSGYLNLVATLPAPKPWLAPDGLRCLLAENIFSLRHPVITVGLDSIRGSLVLSLRQPLTELDEQSVVRLFNAFVQQAIDLHSGKLLPSSSAQAESMTAGKPKTTLTTYPLSMTVQENHHA